MASPFFLSKIFLCCAVAIGLTACSQGQDLDPNDGIHDPGEMRNRKVHEFNRKLDEKFVRPAASGYTKVLPDEIEDSVGNFATNLGRPAQMVNATLQGDLKGLGLSTSRFLINSVLGFGGLFDVASDFGVKDHETDFGETLHVWGVGEGRYVELPILGPSTSRDAVGTAVDLFTNPLSYKVDAPESLVGTAATAAATLGTRGRYSDTIDSILYESADSYAQARLIYLQNRRHELGQTDETSEIDPFELDTEGF